MSGFYVAAIARPLPASGSWRSSGAIDARRHEEFPCCIPARALEGIEARVKTTNAQLKGRMAKGIKREARSALDLAPPASRPVNEAIADN